jgi:DNA-binding NtrC family response regulator
MSDASPWSCRTILLVSDDRPLIRMVRAALVTVAGVRRHVCGQAKAALARLTRNNVTLVILDAMWNLDALERECLVSYLRENNVPFITIARWHDTGAGPPGAPPEGAVDHMVLPRHHDRLLGLVQGALGSGAAVGQASPRSPVENGSDPFAFVFASGHVNEVQQLRRVVSQDTTILLTGETGTGKTRLARQIHGLSPRRLEPFLVVNCGALSPSLIESELFGHVTGSFTGADRDRQGKLAEAGRGTLLLDEINALPLALQAKLLRAVDERIFEPVGASVSRPLQARLMAATNTPLEAAVAAGRFRPDLYFRIHVVAFYLPPLRDRRASIAPLAHQFLVETAARNRPDVRGLSAAAVRALERHDWPGNFRELRNVIERAVALCPGQVVQLADLPEALTSSAGLLDSMPARNAAAKTASLAAVTLVQARAVAEQKRIQEALVKHRDNRCHAAAALGISRMALYKKLHKYGLIRRQVAVGG